MENRFDEHKLQEHLSNWQPDQRVLFALSCAERMFPNYILFSKLIQWGDPGVLREGLDLVWGWLVDGAVSKQAAKKLQAACEDQAPDTEDFDTVHVSSALDAANAVAAVISMIFDPKTEAAVEIATYGRDTVDMYVQESEGMDSQNSRLEDEIWRHPLMQLELKNQRQALELIEQGINIESASHLWKSLQAGSLGL